MPWSHPIINNLFSNLFNNYSWNISEIKNCNKRVSSNVRNYFNIGKPEKRALAKVPAIYPPNFLRKATQWRDYGWKVTFFSSFLAWIIKDMTMQKSLIENWSVSWLSELRIMLEKINPMSRLSIEKWKDFNDVLWNVHKKCLRMQKKWKCVHYLNFLTLFLLSFCYCYKLKKNRKLLMSKKQESYLWKLLLQTQRFRHFSSLDTSE